jgi:capsular polysaccharide transport system permease protein
MRRSAIAIQANVVHALMLRDMQTRFGGNYVNYLVAFAWPLAHMAVLLFIYNFLDRGAPVGTSTTIFFATGLIPYMAFNYPARFMMTSLLMNQPLLSFPIVKVMDVMLARAFLEIITGFAVIAFSAFVLFAMGFDIQPRDPGGCAAALAAMLFLAVGVGLLNALIVIKLRGWLIAFILITILLYLTSGILFVASSLPQRAQDILSWNPLLHGVEWFRLSFFETYPAGQFPDRTYLLSCGLFTLAIALVAERTLRRFILTPS